MLYQPEPYETAVAVRSFVQEVEAVANGGHAEPFLLGGKLTDELDAVTADLFDRHPVTQVMGVLTEMGA